MSDEINWIGANCIKYKYKYLLYYLIREKYLESISLHLSVGAVKTEIQLQFSETISEPIIYTNISLLLLLFSVVLYYNLFSLFVEKHNKVNLKTLFLLCSRYDLSCIPWWSVADTAQCIWTSQEVYPKAVSKRLLLSVVETTWDGRQKISEFRAKLVIVWRVGESLEFISVLFLQGKRPRFILHCESFQFGAHFLQMSH